MTQDDVRRLIWALPPSERLALLMGVVIEQHNGNPTRPIAALFTVATEMAGRLSPESRFRLSEMLRDNADVLEHPKVQRVAIKE